MIEAQGDASGERYIKGMILGGKRLNKYRISHADLVNGKTLSMQLGKKP